MPKISQYTELAEAPASTDEFVIVDKSDTSMAASGTTKRIQAQYLTIADASTTVKGKVELATDAETTTGTDTVRAITPSNLTSQIGTRLQAYDADLTTWAGITPGSGVGTFLSTPSSANLAAAVTGETGSGALVFGDSPTIASPVIKSWDGWQLYDTVTPTYTSADDPTYTITFASVDLTSVMGVGMRVKFTNNSTTFYGIITAIAFSTNTVVTLYGGTDYDVANSAISAFYYSTMKAPLGFPLDPTKWTVQVTDNTERSQASPVQDTVYNLGTVTISIPIGAWDVEYKSSLYAGASANWSAQMSLSTANNSISDSDFTKQCANDASSGGMFPMYCRKTLVVAVKTLYYLVEKVTNASITTLRINSSIGSDNEKTVINAICAYL